MSALLEAGSSRLVWPLEPCTPLAVVGDGVSLTACEGPAGEGVGDGGGGGGGLGLATAGPAGGVAVDIEGDGVALNASSSHDTSWSMTSLSVARAAFAGISRNSA